MAEKSKESVKAEKKVVKSEKKTDSALKKKEKPEQKVPALKKDKKTREEMHAQDVLKFVLMTEKAVQLIESQNKLVFVVDRRATKPAIKKAAESMFNSKIINVKTVIDQSGRKKAFIRFTKEGEAGEIAIRLGII